ncbi:MAG: hypothetical protein HGA80_01685 [Candidatus Omnitrophica bacterium]|nr:hypothetical protein [Candidatus Omnitrophota bacterium]
MQHRQMLEERCPGAVFIGVGILDGFWLVYDGFSTRWGGAVANIIPSRQDEVWGGLFQLTEDQLAALDAYEGSPKYYQRRQVEILRPGIKDKVLAWIYYRQPQAAGVPSKRYLETVIRGARDCRLPEDYIHSVLDVVHKA